MPSDRMSMNTHNTPTTGGCDRIRPDQERAIEGCRRAAALSAITASNNANESEAPAIANEKANVLTIAPK